GRLTPSGPLIAVSVGLAAVEFNKWVQVLFGGNANCTARSDRLNSASSCDCFDSSCRISTQAPESMICICVSGLLKFCKAGCLRRSAIRFLYHSNNWPCFPWVRIDQLRIHDWNVDSACGSGGGPPLRKCSNSCCLPART